MSTPSSLVDCSDPTPTAQQTIAVTGASGLIGTALQQVLSDAGHRVLPVTRRKSDGDEQLQWDPANGFADSSRLEGIDAVVHLAGENIAGGRWNRARKSRIHKSRVEGTRCLVDTLKGLDRKPSVLVCASAIGFYGNRGDQLLDEETDSGTGFLPDVCTAWEAATKPAVDAGIRVVNLRIGVVLSRDGGALAQMLTPFRFCAGGRVGSGQQYWSWISIQDVVGAILHVLSTNSLSGPVNCVAPNAATNSLFTQSLGEVLRRPTIFPLPGFVARLVLGEMANDLLLASTRVVPRKLLNSGYDFQFSELKDALAHQLKG